MTSAKPTKRGRGRPRLPPAQVLKFKTISVRLEEGICEAFHSWCEARNTTANSVLREFVRKKLAE